MLHFQPHNTSHFELYEYDLRDPSIGGAVGRNGAPLSIFARDPTNKARTPTAEVTQSPNA